MKISSKFFVVLIILSAFLLSQLAAQQTSTADYTHYLDQFVDTSVNPGDNFFRYAVGKWIKNNPIPSNENSWGIYSVIQDETYQRLIKVSEAAAANANAQKGSNEQKIGDFWYAGMDTDSIEKAGITPLKEEFDQIEAIHDKESLLAVVAHLQYIGVGALYAQGIFQDEMNSSKVALHLYQGGLGLPSRDYYFDKDERTTKIRAEYVDHVKKMFQFLADSEAKAAANSKIVMKIETDLAGASRKLEDLRDPYKNYNAVVTKEMAKFTPSIDWIDFLSKQGIQNLDSVIVGQPEFFTQVEKSLKSESIDHWKTYLRWQLINTFANRLSSKFDNQNFYFYGTILQGTPEQRPRWKRILDAEENYLGDALGQLYVQKYFSPQTKQRYEKLTDEIFAAFRDRIQKLEWMSAETKEKAQHRCKKSRLPRKMERLFQLGNRPHFLCSELHPRQRMVQ
jgi:putative endopeptidase